MVLEYLPTKLGNFWGKCRYIFQHHGSHLGILRENHDKPDEFLWVQHFRTNPKMYATGNHQQYLEKPIA